MQMRRVFEIVPLLAIPVGIYAAAALIGASAQGADVFVQRFESGSMPVRMPSDMTWWLSGGDLVVLLAVVLLFVELIRGTGASRYAILHHTAAVVLFLACLGLFALVPAFATTTWFLLTVMAGLDIVGGVLVHMAAQGGGGGGGGGPGGHGPMGDD
jgi:hypothetical protein